MSDAQPAPIDAATDEKLLFSPKVVLGMVVAGVFAFSAFVVLSTYAPDLRSGDNGKAHALSRSAVGYGGMVQLLRGLGEPVLVARRSQRYETPALVVLTPDTGVAGQAYLDAAVVLSTTLVVLPKWSGQPDPLHKGWVGGLQPIAADDLAGLLKTINLP